MSGLVGVIAQETARFSTFGAALSDLRMPKGATTKWIFGHDIAANTNLLVHEMYRREADWLWIMGDDHVFSPGLLLKLLECEKDIVTPLCLLRNAPFRPVCWTKGKRLDLTDYPEGGCVPVDRTGSGGMLVRRCVFDALSDPWFESGALNSTWLAEDWYFCDKAVEAGFQPYVDLDARMGHSTTAAVWPVREEDGWTFAFSFMGGFEITMPPGSSWQYADSKAAKQ